MEYITIDSRNPLSNDIYSKCIDAWFDDGYHVTDTYDAMTTMTKDDKSVVISYGLISGYAP